ncbi:MAG: winged helix-turn-helix transcriptional regulator [Candidatus Aenigmarchaeota archaeon]|nr:winged helix-turn-helix transcriptional regulator [Candidatus Aenigmarchaeota archaeon]
MKEVLKELGLTNNETEVYLTLLRKGSISVNEIAQRSGLHRQAVYDALDRLLEKGFVSFVIKNGKKYFQGIKPEKISEYLKEKEEKFNSILPGLIDLTKLPREDTFVEVFKSKGIVKTVYSDIINEFQKKSGDVLISGVDERKFMEEDKIALCQHLKKLQKLKCMERIMIKDGDTYFVKGAQTEYRWVPAESFNPTPIYVYGNKMAFIIWGNPNYAIIIENKNLADSYRKQFNMIWKISKKAGK